MATYRIPGSHPAVPAQAEPTAAADREPILLESSVEILVQSSRARNALRSLGCKTVRDVLRVDLLGPARGIGPKTRNEVLTALRNSGFRYAAAEERSDAEIRRLDRSLKRMNDRINAALGTVAREIALMQKSLRRHNEVRNGYGNGARKEID